MSNATDVYLLGSDIGSSSCKTVLVNAQAEQVASASRSYSSSYPQPDWVEQRPQDWYQAMCDSTQAVLAQAAIDPHRIKAVSIVGVTHNPVLLGSDLEVLRPAIHFWDQRSKEQVEAIKTRWGDDVCRRALNDVGVLWTWPQLLWLKEHEAATWEKISTLLFPKDYVRHRLAPSLLTDTVDPTGTLLYDPQQQCYITDFISDLGLPVTSLPEPHDPFEKVASVSAQAARDTGLVEGTCVITGTTDTAAEVLGSGALEAGQAVVKLASVGRIMVVTAAPLEGPARLNYPHVLAGLWYPGSVTKYGAGAYHWAKELLWSEHNSDQVFADMDHAASSIPAGSDGVLFHPHLLGEFAPQWRTDLRASFSGVSIDHQRPHLTRAVLEGVAFQLRAAFEDLASTGIAYNSIRLLGGGASSSLWAQIIADVLDVELIVPRYRSAAFGAALMAGIGQGLFSNQASELQQLISQDRSIQPGPDGQRYQDVYSSYLKADRILSQLYGV